MTTASSIMNATFPRAIYAAAYIAVQIGDDRAAAWMARRLPKVMRPDGELMAMLPWPFSEVFGRLGEAPCVPAVEGRAWLDDAREWAERSARALLAASRAGDSIIHQEFALPRHFGNVRDWLNALPETDPRMLDKLPRVTWDQAVEHACAYHERLKRGRLRVAGDEGTVDPIPTIAGHRWLHLVTPAALDAESAAMGHCVGDGGYDYLTWKNKNGVPVRPGCAAVAAAGIWSLRDREGRSVLTAEIASYGRVNQVQRRFNERPMPEDTAHVVILLDRLRAVMPGFRDPDWIVLDERDGSRHHRDWMPDGIHLKGPILFLQPCAWRRLPTAMHIEGNVVLWGAHEGVLDLDMGLHVTGRLKVRQGVRLTGELVVGGDLDLRSADVKDVPEGARIAGKVMTEAPVEDFSTWGDFMQVSLTEMVDGMGRTWRDIAGAFRENALEFTTEVTDRQITVHYGGTEIRRTAERGVPHYLRHAPRYRQMEHRGGRRPLR